MGSPLSLDRFGAVGDGVADDTAPVLKAIGSLSNRGVGGSLYVPIGHYRVTRPIAYRGLGNGCVRIYGEMVSPGLAGSVFVYDGPPGAGNAVLDLSGGYGLTVERVGIDCRRKAQFGVYLHYDVGNAVGTANTTFRDLVIGDPVRSGHASLAGGKSAAISVGMNPNGTFASDQCDTVKVDNCTLTSPADGTGADYGIAFGTDNVKNYWLTNTWVTGFKYGAYNGGPGLLTVHGGFFGSNSVADFGGTVGNLTVVGYESEGSGAMLVAGAPGYGAATFQGVQWSSGATLAARPFVRFDGSLTIRDSTIHCQRAGAAPRIFMGGYGGSRAQPGFGPSVTLENNFLLGGRPDWKDADGLPMVCNWNGSAGLFDPTRQGGDYGFANNSSWVRARGNVGQLAGAKIPMQNRGCGHPTTVRRVKAAYTAAWDDHTLICDATGGAFAVTLPDATSVEGGWELVGKNVTANANALTVASVSAQTFDGAAGPYKVPVGVRRFVSDGANWVVF